ncbi:YhdP family protein [Roseomonas sp. USHLN139]|uniref:YhdP family protein n=1 Tax=Roseomonas sp. USHLN139 TaxID=3081298 RepID=UPI003B01B2E9
MPGVGGQALRFCGWLGRLLIGLALIAGLGAGALAWRLSQGPLHLPVLARMVERLNVEPGLTVGDVAIAWAGFRQGTGSPLELRLSDVQLRDAAGSLRQVLPDARVSLAPGRLLRGQVTLLRIAVERPSILLERDAQGGISLAMGRITAPALPGDVAGPPIEDPAADQSGGGDVLSDLIGNRDPASPFAALREVEITEAQLTVLDRQLDITWRLQRVALRLRRLPGGNGLSGQGSAELVLPGPGNVLPVHLAGSAQGEGPVFEGSLSLPNLEPARIAALLPALAPLRLVDGRATLDLAGRFDGRNPQAAPEVSLRLAAGPGGVTLNGQRTGFAALLLQAEGTPTALTLQRLRLELPPIARETGSQTSPPVLEAHGQAALRDHRWRAGLQFTLDQLQAADLGAYWPQGVVANARHWIVENLTGGTLRDGRFSLQAEAGADLAGFAVTQLDGTLRAEGATVHWLRPMAPLEGINATARFSLPEISIQVEQARQSGTALTSPGATIRFHALDTAQEQAEIEARLRGPVPDLVALIRHPRLKLFERRPLDLKEPGGQLEGTLHLAFPLLEDIPSEVLKVAVQARITQMRLADVVMGKRLERGTAELSVDNSRLRASGNAQLSGIPTRLEVEMDFRPGAANQVVERIRAEARPDAARIAEFGLDLEGFVAGPVGVQAVMEKRRNGETRVGLTGDLGASRMSVSPFAWSKPPGVPASAQAELRVAGEALRAVESFQVEAPGLFARGQVAFAGASRVERIDLSELRLQQSRLTAEARPPATAGGPWRFRASGPVMDLGPSLAEPERPGAAAAEGPPISVEGHFDRVLLGEGRALTAVQGRAAADARGVWREARVTGQAGGANGGFDITVTPVGNARDLRLNASNAGALLRAFDVLQTLEGGRLAVTGRWASNLPGAVLTGNAEMSDFAVQEAQGAGKLLQALTVYGVFDAVRGTGLSFSRMVAPFSLTPEALLVRDARAFSPSLGVTAKGSIARHAGPIDLEGTIVPAYMLNSLLGQIPLLGRLFSPEQGGGLFAATWRMRGPAADPAVSVNPLAALTPGFLRGIFGGNQGSVPPGPAQ